MDLKLYVHLIVIVILPIVLISARAIKTVPMAAHVPMPVNTVQLLLVFISWLSIHYQLMTIPSVLIQEDKSECLFLKMNLAEPPNLLQIFQVKYSVRIVHVALIMKLHAESA